MKRNSLRIIRKDYGYTQEELAKYLNVSQQTVSKYESGVLIPPSDTLLRYSELFEMSVERILSYGYKAPSAQAVYISRLSYLEKEMINKRRSLTLNDQLYVDKIMNDILTQKYDYMPD